MARKEWRGYEPEVHVLDVGLWIIKIVTTNPFKRFFKNTWRPSEYFLYAKAYTLADFIYDNKKPVSGDCFTDFDKGFIGLENIIVKYGYWRKQHTMPNEGMHQSKEMGGDEVIKSLSSFEEIIKQAARELSPSVLANYLFGLVKTYNSFYQDCPIIRELNQDLKLFRLSLSSLTARVLFNGMSILGIELPRRM